MTPTGNILSVQGWSCGYLAEPIVHELSFALAKGSITCIVGSNGAGKSTLLRSIYGTIKRFAGTLVFRNEKIEHLSPVERMARGISFVPQGRCNFPYLTVAENMQLAGHTLPRARAEAAIAAQADKFPVLRRKWRQMAGNLSGGEQQVMEIAMVMVADPILLLIDEPSLGLAPRIRDEVFSTIRGLTRDGVTVLMVEQNVRGGLAISDRALVMDLGRKVMDGLPEEIIGDPRISAVFLGGVPKQPNPDQERAP